MDEATGLERQEKKILKMSKELEQAKEEYKKLQEERSSVPWVDENMPVAH